MAVRETTVGAILAALTETLQLQHLAGDLSRTVRVSEHYLWPADLVGHLNIIHPSRIQVVGAAEFAWAARHPAEKTQHVLATIAAAQPPAIIVADGQKVPPVMHQVCVAQSIALLASPRPTAEVIDRLRHHLSRTLAERIVVHGVLMDVLGVGVLITGEAGTGKSELALELITRGHGLVADDAVELARVAPTVLEGSCPELLRHYIEVRGLGLLDVRTIFGETSVRRKMRLRLIANLKRIQPDTTPLPRLSIEEETEDILGVAIPRVHLPVASGRNMAVLLEAAVRNFVLKRRGIDSTREFLARHEALLAASNTPHESSEGEAS